MEAELWAVGCGLCAGRRRVLVVAPSWPEATAVRSSASVLRMVSCIAAFLPLAANRAAEPEPPHGHAASIESIDATHQRLTLPQHVSPRCPNVFC